MRTTTSFNSRIILAICIIPALLQSCLSPSIYLSNSTNTPNLTNKNEGNVNTYIGLSRIELQGAYSPTRNFGILFNGYSTYNAFDNLANGQSNNTSSFAELAGGFYHPLGSLSNWFFDVYGGYGMGSRTYNGAVDQSGLSGKYPTIVDIYTSYNKLFIQPTVFYKRQKFEFSLSIQFSELLFNYINVWYFETYSSYQGHPNIPPIYSGPQNYVNENFAATFKYGLKRVKLITQIANTIAPSAVNPSSYFGGYDGLYFNARPIEINVGIQYSFGHKE